MSSIVKQRIRNHIYLYESISYRNEEGKPRNRRTAIGKINPATGVPIYKPEYLERMSGCGNLPDYTPEKKEPSFSIEDIRQSTIVEIGLLHLYRALAQRSGLMKALEDAMPLHYEEVFTLVSYLVTSGDPFSYCDEWLSDKEVPNIGRLTSQRISELLSAITQNDRDKFYAGWCSLRSEKEYLALDITSVSSYSEFIESVAWGYNRDNESLAQINICMLMGYQSRLPIYQSVYNGSLKDVSALQKTIKTFRALAGEKPIVAVMDKGFFSTKNVTAMLECNQHTEFLIAVPFTSKFALAQIESERKDIDTLANTIVISGDSMRAVTKIRRWNASHKVITHIYYNAKKAQGIRESLYAHVALLKEYAEQSPEKCINNPDYTKYLIIRHSDKECSGYTVNLRDEVVSSELRTAGWMILISNYVKDAKEAIRIYREKDIVEKGFQRLKNCLDLNRLRVHREDTMQNKVFIGFISLILLSNIHQVLSDAKLYNKMTMKHLMIALAKVKAQIVNGIRILFPLTKEQRDIFHAVGVDAPL